MPDKGKSKRGLIVSGIVLIIAIAAAIALSDFSSDTGSDGGAEDLDAVVIGVPNWESATGTAYILREMLEKSFGVTTRLHSGTNEELYAGIANGTVHIHPEGWTPNHNDWHAQFADTLARNRNGVAAIQGMCVDRSLAAKYGITSIQDLLDPEKVRHFDSDGDGRGEMWIGVEGWGALTIEKIRAKSYGYDAAFELLEMDESVALERFAEATAAGKLFALYCYTPHWMWQVHDLYQLQEPPYDPAKWQVIFPSEDVQWLEKSNAAVAYEPAELHLYYAKMLEQQHPDIAQFLQNVQFTMDELLAITYGIEKGDVDPSTYAQQWVLRNRP